jgi:hypothetical protein
MCPDTIVEAVPIAIVVVGVSALNPGCALVMSRFFGLAFFRFRCEG